MATKKTTKGTIPVRKTFQYQKCAAWACTIARVEREWVSSTTATTDSPIAAS